jgi:uncharacterized protein (UPF0261 family)
LRPHIEVIEVDAHINDPEFADTAASAMMQLIQNSPAKT